MKIFINRRPVEGPWGGGNLFVEALYEYLPLFGHQIVSSLQDNPGIVFIQNPVKDSLGVGIKEAIEYKNYNKSVKLVHRVNECDIRKNTFGLDNFLRECSKYTNQTIFVSNWMKDYHLEKGWFCKDNRVVYNGVNKEHFKLQPKIQNGKINLVTHHWSNNPMKGFDIYEAIDRWVGNRDDFTFTYIGRENGTFSNTNVISPLAGKALGEELGKYDLYISASRFDPGPNHIIEAISCGLPLFVHKDGGGSVEFSSMVDNSHLFANWDSLRNMLTDKEINSNNHLECSLFESWENCIKEISRCINEL